MKWLIEGEAEKMNIVLFIGVLAVGACMGLLLALILSRVFHKHIYSFHQERMFRIRDYYSGYQGESGWTSRLSYVPEEGKECEPVTRFSRVCQCGKVKYRIATGHFKNGNNEESVK